MVSSEQAGQLTQAQDTLPAAAPAESIESEQTSDRARIARAAAIIMVGTILSRVLGLGREQITAYLFGAGDKVAAFTIADNIQTILFNLVISGMMEAALVPVLSSYAAPEHRAELRRIVGALLVLAVIVVGAAVVLMEIFAPLVVRGMTVIGSDTQVHSAGTALLTRQLVRLILPAVLLLALSTILMATLYALHRYTRPAMSLAARNAAIVAVLVGVGWTSFGIHSLAVGTVLGAFLLVVMQLPGLRDAMPQLNFHFRHPAIKKILALYLPISVGLISNTVALVIDRNLAYNVGQDALGAMRYATALNQMILGIVAAATSLAALPTLSRHFSNGDELGFERTLSNGLKMVTVMAVPATFGLAAIAWPTVDLVFRHGATTSTGAHTILIALLAYLPGTFFAAFDQVLIFAYYARQNTRTPVIVGVLAVGVYLIFAFSLISPFGMAGLVLANSAQFTFHAIVMWFLVRRSLGHVGDRTVLRTLRIALGVGGVMAAIVFVLGKVIEVAPLGPLSSLELVREFAAVLIPVAVGAFLYAGGLYLFGVDEIHMIYSGVARKLRRA